MSFETKLYRLVWDLENDRLTHPRRLPGWLASPVRPSGMRSGGVRLNWKVIQTGPKRLKVGSGLNSFAIKLNSFISNQNSFTKKLNSLLPTLNSFFIKLNSFVSTLNSLLKKLNSFVMKLFSFVSKLF